MKRLSTLLLAALLCVYNHTDIYAQGTAFTYQGQLINGGLPVNGSYDFTFALYNASTGGGVVAGPVTNLATVVSNGFFTATIDFGAGVFTGNSYWLQIAVETNAGGGFSALSPLQALTPAPYAIFAPNAAAAVTAGSVQATNIIGLLAGDGSGLTNLNGAQITGTVPTTVLPTNVIEASGFVTIQSRSWTNAGVYTVTVPAGVSQIVAKLWGAGGGRAVDLASSGGGGAYVQSTIPVTPGQQFTVVVGQHGSAGGNIGSGGAAGGPRGFVAGNAYGGTGGQGSSLFFDTGSAYVLEALAGAGGGGGQYGGVAAPGGNSPTPTGANTTGGYSGIGGTGTPYPGQNYPTNATTTGLASLSTTNGNGGAGSSSGGGGGGGYGGGGGGGYQNFGISGGGGGGSYGDLIVAGNGYIPGSTNDSYYVYPAGFGGTAAYDADGEVVLLFQLPAINAPGFVNATRVSAGFLAGDGSGISNVVASGVLPGVSITNATLSNATINNVVINTATITNATLLNTTLTGGTINGVTISNSVFYGNAVGAAYLSSNQTFAASNTFNGPVALNGPITVGGNITFNNGAPLTNFNSYYSQSGFYESDRGGPAQGVWAYYGHNQRAYLWSSVANADRFSVDASGNVRASGTISPSTAPDVAETISAAANVEVGDVVSADPMKRESVVRCSQDAPAVLGVVSDGSGGILINARAYSVDGPLTGQPLVLAGRVPVKISLENGPIRIGDTLAPSSVPGVAMRANGAGVTVGIALDNFSEADAQAGGRTVLCFVKPTEGTMPAIVNQLRGRLAEQEKINSDLERRLESLERMLNERH